MTERQRPRETAGSFRNSLAAEFIEKRQALEELAGLFANDVVDLRRRDPDRGEQSEIDLNSRSRGNRLVRFASGGSLFDGFEVDLQPERRLRPDRGIDRQPPRRPYGMAVDNDLPQDFTGARNRFHDRGRKRGSGRRLGEELDVPFVVARLNRLRKMGRRALSHHQRPDVHLFPWQRRLLRARKCGGIFSGEKGRPDLKESNVALHTSEVVFGARNESAQQVTTQKRLVFRQRIGDANRRTFTLCYEWHRPHFV